MVCTRLLHRHIHCMNALDSHMSHLVCMNINPYTLHTSIHTHSVEAVVMSAGELEHEWAGTPGRLIRERYRRAAEITKVRGKLSCLLINDIDAGLGMRGWFTCCVLISAVWMVIMGTLHSAGVSLCAQCIAMCTMYRYVYNVSLCVHSQACQLYAPHHIHPHQPYPHTHSSFPRAL